MAKTEVIKMSSDKKYKNLIKKLGLNNSKLIVPILFVILFAIIGATLLVISRAAGNATLSISPASSSPSLGSTFTVTILENSFTEAINAVQADLSYDSSKLTYISSSISSVFDTSIPVSTSTGKIKIAAATTTTVTGSQTVATITFMASGVGTAAVSFDSSSAIIRPSDYTNVLGAPVGGSYIIADKNAPTVPAGLTKNSSTSSSIAFSWTASTDNVAVAGYNIYRNAVKVGTSPTNSYNDTGLTAGTTYSYAIEAFDAAGNISAKSTTSSFSIADTIAPTVPAGLTKNSSTSSSIAFSWTASTDNVAVTGYNIYRNAVKVGTSPTNSYNDTGLTSNTNYSYTISAYDASGNTSALSTASSFITDYKIGDMNGDGAIGIYELNKIATNFGKSGMTRADGDIETANGVGIINIFDLSVLATNWGK